MEGAGDMPQAGFCWRGEGPWVVRVGGVGLRARGARGVPAFPTRIFGWAYLGVDMVLVVRAMCFGMCHPSPTGDGNRSALVVRCAGPAVYPLGMPMVVSSIAIYVTTRAQGGSDTGILFFSPRIILV